MRSLRELLLGARMALAGGASGWLRAGLTAVGVGLGVAMLLVAVSALNVLAAQDAREGARADGTWDDPPPASDTTILVSNADTWFRGEPIRGRLLDPEGAKPPRPPGLAEIPRPGEMAVSPALARLLKSPDAALLRERLDFPIVATIGDEGLAGPGELAFYLGSDSLGEPGGTVVRRAEFGEPVTRGALDAVLSLVVVVAVVVLLLPVGLLVAAAVRFGGEARDRRLAGVRLLGADARMARRIASGEALGSSILGLAIGAVIFLLGRSFVDRVELLGISAFPSDLRPDPLLTVLLVVAVPVAAVAVTVVSLRRAVIEPFGVMRRSGEARRTLWWRLLLPAMGVVLLLTTLGTVSGGGQPNVVQVGAGLILTLVGVAVLLPWAVQAGVRRMRGGPVSWQLAVRRLQLDSSTPARAVMGIAVAVAGAIGMQTLFVSVQENYVTLTGADPSRASVLITMPVQGWSVVQRLDADLSGVPGVRTVHSKVTFSANIPPAGGPAREDDPFTLVTVGDCATLRELAQLESCVDGDAFLVTAADGQDTGVVTPHTGATLRFRSSSAEWTVPVTAQGVPGRADAAGGSLSGVFATPSALPTSVLAGLSDWVATYVDADATDPDVIERLRTIVWNTRPGGYIGANVTQTEARQFATVRRGLLIGATLTLTLIGVSLLIGLLEQIRERRRVLASLVAFGVQRRTLAWSILWQTLVPVALGLLVAVAAGVAVGAALLKMVDAQISIDWPLIGLVCAVSAFVVLAVTASSLPVLWRLMRADGLRTE